MAENAFRTQLSSWRTNRNAAVEDSEAETFLGRWNPFKRGGLRLPLTENEAIDAVEEPGWFTLSRWDRLLIFGGCLIAAVGCFALCFALLPVMALKPRKFAVLWTLGSLFFVISFGVLQGPVSYFIHLISAERLPFSLAYFGSMIATMVFSLGLKSTLLTIVAVVIQILAALWYTVSYFPMGSQSLKFASRIGARQVTSWINSG